MVTDYDTSHELRAAEIRNLQNSFEEEISMVSLPKSKPTRTHPKFNPTRNPNLSHRTCNLT